MTGDQNDVVARIKATLPPWFPSPAAILDALLAGFGNALAFVYSEISYAKLQTRIATATDDFLDLISIDFLGSALPRKTAETDTSFRRRIQNALIRKRVTRASVVAVLTQLTGHVPGIFEPWNATDTGGLDAGGLGFDVAGAWGDSPVPNNLAYVTVIRPSQLGLPLVAGWDVSVGAFDIGQIEWVSPDMISAAISDSDLTDAIESVRPTGTTLIVSISG